MRKPQRRAGKTVTFSVSVDVATKKLLRTVADRSFGGNVSELISSLAREAAQQAARQQAAGEFLARYGRKRMSEAELDAFEAEIAAELARQGQRRTQQRRSRHRRAG